MRKNIRQHRRRGAIQSLELILVLPIFAIAVAGTVECCLMLWTKQKLQLASWNACRVVAGPGNSEKLEVAARRVAHETIGDESWNDAAEVLICAGLYTGDRVSVEVRAPADRAVPNWLGGLGLSLNQQSLTASTVMRKE